MATPLPKYRINDSSFANVTGDLTQATAETRYIKKAGGGMTGALIVPTPTAAQHAATRAYADARIPAGVMMPWGGAANTAPAGWLYCGPARNVSRTTYATLYGVIGIKYGAGDGTTFGLPTIQARAPVGVDGTADFADLGDTAGAPTLVLTSAMVPNSTGTITMHNQAGATILSAAGGVFAGFQGSASTYHSHSTATAGANSYGTVNLTSEGGGAAHANNQPYLIFQFIIKY